MTRSTIKTFMLLMLTIGLAWTTAHAANIEQSMSPEEFKAAGLDKLSAEELVQLNVWLARQASGNAAPIAAGETTAAPVVDNGPPIAAKYRKPDASGSIIRNADSVSSRIVGYFEGWRKGTVFKLENGQHWRVSDDRRFETSSEDSPEVTIEPGFMNSWLMKVGKYNRPARVQRIK